MERLFRRITGKTPIDEASMIATADVPLSQPDLLTSGFHQSEPVVPTVILENREGEISEEERKQWETAYLGKDFLGKREYGVSLTLHDNPSIRVFAAISTDSLGVEIDIPLIDRTPEQELLNEAYLNTTLFGEIDPEKYRSFATEEYKKEQLFAFLNRKMAGVEIDDVPDWFYSTFNMDHFERYGAVHISSHGGGGEYGHDFNATINPINRSSDYNRRDETQEASIQRANDYVQTVRQSLPHIDVKPLPVKSYLQDVQDTLRFLPRDWAAK
jgi:hypothetical protein